MPTLGMGDDGDEVLASLYVEAVRQGEAAWFRVASNSMTPLFAKDDRIYVEPARASDLRPGDIAAFETEHGLMVHRIIALRDKGNGRRWLQMPDVELHGSWLEERVIVGRVSKVQRRGNMLDLRGPVALHCGIVTASVQHELYKIRNSKIPITLLHMCTRLLAYGNFWCIYLFCRF